MGFGRMCASGQMPVVFITITHIFAISEQIFATETTFEDSHGFVVFSLMVLNHADQLPEKVILPEDHDSDLDLDEDDFGLLTETGKMRAYKLGLWTRERYNDLLDGEPYNTSLLQMKSSSYDQTVSSGQLFFAGFYPPTDEEKEKWHKDIEWQPISILSLPRFHDRMILPTESCARLDRQMDQIIYWSEIRDFHDDYRELLNRIQAHIDVPATPDDNMAHIIDTIYKFYNWLRVQQQLGLPVPEWAESMYPELRRHVQYFKKKVISPEMLRLKGGPLFSDIVRILKSKRDDPHFARLFHFYVGHDTTIMLLLKTLGVFDEKLIHFCAVVFFELRIKLDEELDHKYFITVWYKNSDDIEAAPTLLDLPFCPNPCSFEDFLEKTEHLLISPSEWEVECRNSGLNYNALDLLL